ncbi:MAG: efflux RND transporter periplasmic adaptor subunit, partial [Deltaproteobacteria bacterium]|nr:efflux RND transporter periplasmic adaptor subunit [Deltaproteobacteria bacterium]
MQLTRGIAVQAVYATGTVEPEVMLPIATRGSARLLELRVDEGMSVEAGQLLARLENDDLRSSLAALRAKEQFARSEFERNAGLVKQGAISQQAYSRASSDWEAAKAASAQAAAMVGYMDLSSPAAGKIIRRDGEIGQLIPANQPVFWLSVSSPLRITAEVDEEDISLVKPGQNVAIRADAFPGQVFQGTLKSITPKGDPIARSYRVRVSLADGTPLQIGMTAEINVIVAERENAWLLPTSSLKAGFVWVVE